MNWMPNVTRAALILTVFSAAACGGDAGYDAEYAGDYSSDGAAEASNNGIGDEDGEGVSVAPGQLTAGRFSDLEDWDFWIKLMDPDEDRGFRTVTTDWGLHPFERVEVRLADDIRPAHDVPVELHDGEAQVLWRSKTDVTGTAFVFPNMRGGELPETLQISADGQTVTLEPGQDLVEITAYAQAPEDVLDVLFTIDVTGSMTDEQNYLRAEMADVMARLATERPELEIRSSFNFYCDPDDDFLVESHPFSDVPTALEVLNVGAGCGGGDFPEAVDEGLEDALEHEWSESARARILFLVLDAPPHNDQEGLTRLHDFAEQASAQGIKLVPIVSSGSDHSLEFLMRSLVIATNGTYTFLTAHSGIGGEKLEPTIPSYEVELLNELMLDLLLTESAAP